MTSRSRALCLSGPYVLRGNGSWATAGNLLRPDRVEVGRTSAWSCSTESHRLAIPTIRIAANFSGSVAVFQRNAEGNFEYAAKLVASDALSTGLGLDVEMSGRRVVVGAGSAAYVFELPADLSQPSLVQDDFEDRNTAEWTSIPGSNISVVSSGSSFVYRQSSITGAAGSVRTGVDWNNQAIEADAVPRRFASSGDRWFGLTVRQTDPDDYYYLTVRNSNVVSLRKLENGAINVLDSASLPVVLNRPYRLRLEAVGTRLRGYVDGQLRVEASDSLHTHGAPGLRMFKTAADYDNVVMSPNAQVTIFSDAFEASGGVPGVFPNPNPWRFVRDGGSNVFEQPSLSGGARVTAGVEADDQVIQVRAKAVSFGSGADPWFGVVSRLQNDQNYYYVTMRRSNIVSLRKLVNGAIVVLDNAPLTVSPGTWYTLRLEAIGTSLRAYVNGRLLLEANDNSHAQGAYGLATFSTRARFDNVVVTQP